MEPNNKNMTTQDQLRIAAMTAGIIIGVFLLIWIPFKVIPGIFSRTSSWVGTTLSSTFDSGTTAPENTDTQNSTKSTDTTKAATTTKSSTHYSTAPSYYGLPDLQISLYETGVISNGKFVGTSYFGQNDEIAIKFAVKNVGTNVSGAWRMRLNMPSLSTPVTDSAYQQSLKPGDTLIFTATFLNPSSVGINNAYIVIDQFGELNEISKNNNNLTVQLNVNAASNGYTQNLSAYCYPNPGTATVGSNIGWYAVASGGNGIYTYSWVGSDGFSASGYIASKLYTSPGQKSATVMVSSNGRTVQANCSASLY